MSARAKKSNTAGMILALAIVTVLLIGLAVSAFALQRREAQEQADQQSGTALIDVPDAAIERITVENKRATYSVVQAGYSSEDILQWKLENQDNTGVEQYALKLLVQRCARLTIARDLGKIEEADFAQYGLDDPLATFSVTLADGVRSFMVGNPYNRGYYMLERGVNRLYTVAQTVGTFMGASTDEYRTMPGIAFSTGDLGTLFFRRSGKADIMLAYVNNYSTSGFSWRLLQPIICDTDANLLTEYLKSLADFKAEVFVASDMSAGAEAYGFDHPYVQAVIYPLSETKKAQTILIGDPIDTVSGYRYCVFRTDGEELEKCRVYGVSEAMTELFRVDAINLMNRQFMLTHIDFVEHVQLELRGKTETVDVVRKPILDDDGEQVISESGEKQYAVSFVLNGETLEEKGYRNFYSQLIGSAVVAFLREDDPQEHGEDFLTVRLFTTMTVMGDPNGEEITVEAVFSELDSNYYLVRFNDQTESICKVRKDQIDNILEAYELCKKGLLPPLGG